MFEQLVYHRSEDIDIERGRDHASQPLLLDTRHFGLSLMGESDRRDDLAAQALPLLGRDSNAGSDMRAGRIDKFSRFIVTQIPARSQARELHRLAIEPRAQRIGGRIVAQRCQQLQTRRRTPTATRRCANRRDVEHPTAPQRALCRCITNDKAITAAHRERAIERD